MYPITVYPAISGAFPPASFFDTRDALEYARGKPGAIACSAFEYPLWRELRPDVQIQLAMEFVCDSL